MNTEKLISGISDEYIEEAINAENSLHHSPAIRRAGRLRVRPVIIALFILTLVIVPLSLLPKQTSVSTESNTEKSGAVQVDEDGSEILPGIMIYADITDPAAATTETGMNFPVNININDSYSPDSQYEGIRFHIHSDGNRIDAMTDTGKLTGGQSDKCCYAEDELEFCWTGMTEDNDRVQSANIRIFAVRENRLMMRAVIEVSAKDDESFTAKVTEYENFTDTGGVILTEENRGKYYPFE